MQLSLFGKEEAPGLVRGVEPSVQASRLATKLPSRLYMGTSSWSFPGWEGIVYDKAHSKSALSRHGLAAYAAHSLLRSVGVDRTYYAPLSAEEFASYAALVPEDFRFVIKAHEMVTRAYLRAPTGGGRPVPNELFLNCDYAVNELIGPCREGLNGRAAVLLFQFPPQSTKAMGGKTGFVDRLHRFVQNLPPGMLYAVELRNPEMLTERYAEALVDSCACHCFNVHPTMPPIETQLRLTQGVNFPALVVRWMLRRNRSYGDARDSFAPFNKIVEEDKESRVQIAKMCLGATSSQRDAYVIVNNKAEGSAPLSIHRLAEELAELRSSESAP